MSKKHEDNLEKVIAQNEKEAQEALAHPYGQSSVQLQLFEEFSACTAAEKKNPKNKYGCTLTEETYARFRACGYNQTDSWKKAHPTTLATNNTIYSKASRLEKQDKIQARIAVWKEKILAEALMSKTEFYQRVTEWARKGGKEGLDALKMIGQILGEFKAEKGLPGSSEEPLVVTFLEEEKPATKVDGFKGEICQK